MVASPVETLLRRVFRDAQESPIRAMLALANEPGMISLAGGHPDPTLIPRDWIAEAAVDVLTRIEGPALQYGATDGLPELRESVCTLLRARRIDARPGDVLITTGSQQGISLLMSVLLEADDAVAMAPYNYPAAMQAVRFAAGRIFLLRDNLDGLAELAQASAAALKAVYVVPSFANPTGHCMSLEARLRLLQQAARLGICVIEDDPYGELWFDRPPPDSLYALNQARGIGAVVAYLTSFSKILVPGFRLGALVAPAPLRRAAMLAKQATDVHTGLLEQHVLDAMLRSPRLMHHVRGLRAAYGAKARAMTQVLRNVAADLLAFEDPAGGMFVWARRLGDCDEQIDWFEFGRTHRVLALPGSAFSPFGKCTAYLRLSFANPQIDAVREGIERLAAGLAARATA
jgi:2-aminoadipate transaminase